MSQAYYKLDYSINLREIGVINQSSRLTGEISGGLSVSIRSGINQLRNQKAFPEEIPILQEILLDENAKLTDCIQATYLEPTLGLIISERFKNEVEKLKLAYHRFYEATVHHKRKAYPYYFLLLKDSRGAINYPLSSFNIMDIHEEKVIGAQCFQSPEAQAEHAQKILMADLQLIIPHRISLIKELDMIRIPYNGRIHVSNEFKEMASANRFTGIELKPVSTSYTVETGR